MKGPLTLGGAVLLLSFSVLGQTNQWTKPTSGAWEESYWSLGQLPGPNQDVAIDNDGWKAVAIGPATTANYPQSLSVNTLLIGGPSDSFNTLLLNWAQLNVPLQVHSNLSIAANGALVSHYSALRAANADIAGAASFMDYATEDFGQLLLRSGGTVGLTNGIMFTSNLLFWTGTFTQSGGSHTVYAIGTQSDGYEDWYRSGIYELRAGTLISTHVGLGSGGPYYPEAHGFIHQTGGVHTNTSIDLSGWDHHWATISLGAYALEGGLLDSGAVNISCGYFSQTGGTNRIQELNVYGGDFVLSGGELVTSNESIHVYSEVGAFGFYQTGGVHTVQGGLFVTGSPDMHLLEPAYEVAGGSLVASNIIVQVGAFALSSQGTVSNAGIITLAGGYLFDSDTTATQYLGQLQLATNGDLYTTVYGGTIDLSYKPARTNQTIWRFADSHALPWLGVLGITNWTPDTHIFFGTNAQGLTRAQLDNVIFSGSSWYSIIRFPGMLLPTGELVELDNTNQWTKASDGNWEEANWSLGKLPGLDQGFVAFNNPGGKTLTIGQNTTATVPQSLDVYNLLVDGVPGSLNQLSLNSSGSAVPLKVRWNLTVGTNGAVVTQDSSLQVANALNYGLVDVRSGTEAEFDNLGIMVGGLVNVSDGFLTCSNLGIEGVFRQTGGISSIGDIGLPNGSYAFPFNYSYVPVSSYYNLEGGTLYSDSLHLDGADYEGSAAGIFVQSGGVHTNASIRLSYEGSSVGAYLLQGGLLVSDAVYTEGGMFLQTGGTNLVQSLNGYVTYNLSGGELVTPRLNPGEFVQSGGRLVAGDLEVHYYDRYELSGGRLVTSNIVIYAGTFVLSGDGVVANAGVLTFPDIPYYYRDTPGHLLVANATGTNCFGQLQMAGGGSIDLHDETIQPTTNATVLRFADSHTQPWAAPLQIFHWGARPGDHLYFGTNAQALTAAQLALIQFVSNDETNSGRLLSTGELVPDVPPPMTYTNSRHAMVLSWPGGYQLMTATNPAGPYEWMPVATSPFTNNFNEPQRFFRLQLPPP